MYVCMLCMHFMYVYALLFKLVPQALLKIGSTTVTQNRSTKLVSQTLLKRGPRVLLPQTLLKIGSTSVTQNRSTNVTQNWFHKYYSK